MNVLFPLSRRFVFSCLVLMATAAWARPVLPTFIGDHMVLQAGREIAVWGWANPRESIVVSIANHSVRVTTDSNRHWRARLPAMPAGGPYTLEIRGETTIFVRDVLIGEVWIASGQSNMTFAVRSATGGTEEISRADHPQIRLFTAPKRVALAPQSDLPVSYWRICTPDSVKEFSAVAYAYARKLHAALGVPIGIVVSAWPGTTIETWMPNAAFQDNSEQMAAMDKGKEASPEIKLFAGSGIEVDLEFKDFELVGAETGGGNPVSNPTGSDSKSRMLPYWSYNWDDAHRTFVEISGSESAQTVHVHGRLDFTSQSLLTARLKPDGSAADLSAYTGLRFLMRGKGALRVRFLQPSITDTDDYASGYIKAQAQWQPVFVPFRDLRQEGWGVVERFTPEAIQGIAIESVTTLQYPSLPASGLFNGMIAPLLTMPFRGVIWSQGESNALSAAAYRKLLPSLITGWRKRSGQTDFPFLIVQLPNHGRIPETPGDSAWAELREAQLETAQKVANTGLAVTIDLGDPRNVHPPRKFEVGERLALWALGTTYKLPVTYSGPSFESMEIQEAQAKLRFRTGGGSLRTSDGGPVKGFAIAGEDRRFFWAKAVIDGDRVTVSSPEVPNPVAVRYAWGDSPECNLVNEGGLPASPFRTDSPAIGTQKAER